MYTFKPHISLKPYVPSEGEEFLMDFFNSEGITFQSQMEINDLIMDNCSYRVADFYLPKYNVFVEFLGMWNAYDDKKNDYRGKKTVYEINNLPCLYFYPENLGIIHYTFNKRLRAVLKSNKLKRELFKFNLELFLENHSGSIFGFIICLGLLIAFQFDRKADKYWQWCGIVSGGLVWSSYNIIKGYIKFFKKEFSYVTFAKE